MVTEGVKPNLSAERILFTLSYWEITITADPTSLVIRITAINS